MHWAAQAAHQQYHNINGQTLTGRHGGPMGANCNSGSFSSGPGSFNYGPLNNNMGYGIGPWETSAEAN